MMDPIPAATRGLESLRHGPDVKAESPETGRLARLFVRIGAGDFAALGDVYDGWAAQIYALALWRTGDAADAADVVQEVFVRLVTTRADLGSVRDPRRYLMAMAHRAAADRGRQRRRVRTGAESRLLEAPPSDPDRAVDARRASRLMHLLPPPQREAILLHHFAEMSFREMARVTGVPIFTAASRYRLGMRKLRKWMRGEP